MSDTRERLVRCFQAVFPNLSEADAVRANVHRIAAWDSVATSTLAAAVEEQFNIQFEAREIEKLTSFQAFLDRLDRT